ncbi:Zinc transporter ZIP11 [Aix galericulata]|nr:Zinc transporter ZIP11 [Aix galericulata]
MLAASYWSLLAPAIEMAEESGTFGAFAFLPVAVGFVLGAAFVYGADLLIPVLGWDLGDSGHSQEPRTLWGEVQGSGAGPNTALLAPGHRCPCWWPGAAKPRLGSLESCLFPASFDFCRDRSQIQIARGLVLAVGNACPRPEVLDGAVCLISCPHAAVSQQKGQTVAPQSPLLPFAACLWCLWKLCQVGRASGE